MLVARSLALFAVAAVAEIGGAYLVWQGLRAGRGWPWIVLGGLGLTLYGVVATFQPEANFGRIFAVSSSSGRSCGAWSSRGSAPTGGI